MSPIIFTIILLLTAFILGVLLQPLITKFIKSKALYFFDSRTKRYEIEFKIEFYSQPSIHHLGEQGILVKTDPIKVQVDAETQDEALSIVEDIVHQEIKTELVSIKEIPKI